MTSSVLKAASEWGIPDGYKGADQQWRTFSDKSLNAVVKALADTYPQTEHPESRVYVFTREELSTAAIRLHGNPPDTLILKLESGEEHTIPVSGSTDGHSVNLPVDLPYGYHRLVAEPATFEIEIIVTPQKLLPSSEQEDVWGFTAQIYALRSATSWGIGDAADLRKLCTWAGQQGADFVSINPIHAGSVTHPVENSPYLPSSRRYFTRLMLSIEDLPEYEAAPTEIKQQISTLAAPLKATNTSNALIDRDPIFAAKTRALELLWDAGLGTLREREFDSFVATEGEPLTTFSLWCALTEKYGEENPIVWEKNHGPDSAWAQSQVGELQERIRFYQWLQFLLNTQLLVAQRAAEDAGMSIGIVHDLAIGVKQHSADVWTMPGMMVPTMSVGAPPDNYNQLGQNWSQPPWHPQTLKDSGYAPFIQMIRKLCATGGGIRIDHILGLFRLWWIPKGASPTEGVYVPYPVEDLLKILVLEATRHNCVVIGEDLGTVPEEITELLAQFGLLGTSVLWYEYDDDGTMRSPAETRAQCMMTVSTHDMPPVAAYLAGKQVELRDELGILANSAAEEWAEYQSNRQDIVSEARKAGVWPEDTTPGDDDEVVAIHELMWLTPAKAKAIALTDIAGEQRSQNVPGTNKEYPNWRVPLCDRDGKALSIKDLESLPLWQRLKRSLFT